MICPRYILSVGAFALSIDAFTPSLFRPIRVLPSSSRSRILRLQAEEPSSPSTVDNVRAEASDALTNVGWSILPDEGDLTSDDPFVRQIDAGIQRDVGVTLDELLNPAKVVNLERDLYNLRMELADLTGKRDGLMIKMEEDESLMTTLLTEDFDGGGGGDAADQLRKTILKKERDLLVERRSVFRGWLKNIFLGQAILSFGISYVMATNPYSLFGGFDWYAYYNMDISISVLGYWWWWLFVIPSLRSRRPKGNEKRALDAAFLASPLVSLVAPAATKDTGLIWAVNLVTVALCYGYAYVLTPDENDNDAKKPQWLKFVYKSLDFGSGKERGVRK